LLTGVVSFDRRLVKIVQGSKFNVQGWNSETQRTKPSDGLNDLNEAKRWNGWNVLNPQSMAQLNTAISIAEACVEMNMIGKPYVGELQVRFDEGEQDFVSRKILNGHEAGNGGHSQDRPNQR
jgi:hypothetical protein